MRAVSYTRSASRTTVTTPPALVPHDHELGAGPRDELGHRELDGSAVAALEPLPHGPLEELDPLVVVEPEPPSPEGRQHERHIQQVIGNPELRQAHALAAPRVPHEAEPRRRRAVALPAARERAPDKGAPAGLGADVEPERIDDGADERSRADDLDLGLRWRGRVADDLREILEPVQRRAGLLDLEERRRLVHRRRMEQVARSRARAPRARTRPPASARRRAPARGRRTSGSPLRWAAGILLQGPGGEVHLDDRVIGHSITSHCTSLIGRARRHRRHAR